MAALKTLTRTCERRTLHRESHLLDLSSELLLRRRNYIMNVSGSPFDSYPCENCFITYPTAFVVSWLYYLLKLPADRDDDFIAAGLCKRSCSYHFATTAQTVHLTEGVLYPMGAPFVAGPLTGPPDCEGASSISVVDELDELQHVTGALRLVVRAMRNHHSPDSSVGSADIDLAESVTKLLESRRHFGFDMDCVRDPNVALCRARMFETLYSYDSRVAAETLDLRV